MKLGLIFVSLIVLMFAPVFYFYQMTTKPVISQPLTINGGKYYSSKVTMTVSPTSSTVANTKYIFNVNVGTLPLKYNVSWNPTQLDINYSPTISTHITNYEATYLANGVRPIVLVSTYKVVHEHNIIWLCLIALFTIFAVLLINSIHKERQEKRVQVILDREIAKRNREAYLAEQDAIQQRLRDEEDKKEHEFNLRAEADAKKNSGIVQHAIMNALVSMDNTFKWYDNEDNANRELISTLHALGFGDAVYHQLLNNGRTADGFVSNSIIEGKLDLYRSDDIDRLLGQIDDYLVSSYDIHIVLYGVVETNALYRIKGKVNSNPNRLFLSYLTEPQRTRKDSGFTEETTK